MTLNQLSKINVDAFKAWVLTAPVGTLAQSFYTTRAYKAGGKLFLVWNNNCYYEAFIYDPSKKKWRSLSESKSWASHKDRVPAYYIQACKTIGRLDKRSYKWLYK